MFSSAGSVDPEEFRGASRCNRVGRGFSRNATGSTPTSSHEEIRDFFYVKKFKNSAPKINQKPVQNSMFLDFLN